MSQPLASPANLNSYKTLLTKGSKVVPKKEEFRFLELSLASENLESECTVQDWNYEDPKFRPSEVKRYRKRSKSRSPSPKPALKKPKPVKKKEKIDYDVPDRHFGDYFCKACECHMNSEDMWYHHISGKRHAKNTKGLPIGVVGKKYDDVEGELPEAKRLIDAEEAPLVGLSDVRESQKPDRTTYYCFLCSASIETAPLLIEHLISSKHRMNYLKEYDNERFKIINESNLNREQMEAIVLECVSKIEDEKGRGRMKIQRKIPGRDDDYPKPERSKQSWKQPASSSPFPLSGANLTPRAPPKSEGPKYKDPYPEYDDRDRYYDRSPERMAPRESDLLPRDNKYNSRRDYYDDDYRMPPKVSSKPPMGINSNDGDLRQVLEQKRSLEGNVTDEALSIISALPTVSFFQLVLFKLDSIDIENEMELKYLDRVVNKTTSMSVKVNSQKFTPSLIEKFQESVKKNSLEVSSAQSCSTSMQDLLRLVEDYKEQRNLDKPVESRTANTLYSNPQVGLSRELPETPRYSMHSGLYSSSEVSRNQASYNSTPQVVSSTVVSSAGSNPLQYGSHQSSSVTYDSGYSSFSNTVSIPGLTLTQGQDHSETISPFRELEARAKSLFGTDQWSSAQTSGYAYGNDPRY